jgi:hypothetical protein
MLEMPAEPFSGSLRRPKGRTVRQKTGCVHTDLGNLQFSPSMFLWQWTYALGLGHIT